MKTPDNITQAERKLSGYCPICGKDELQHDNDCPFNFESLVAARLADQIKTEIDKQILDSILTVSRTKPKGPK